MCLNSAVDAPLNTGIASYRQIFFSPDYVARNPERAEMVEKLRSAIDEQVRRPFLLRILYIRSDCLYQRFDRSGLSTVVWNSMARKTSAMKFDDWLLTGCQIRSRSQLHLDRTTWRHLPILTHRMSSQWNAVSHRLLQHVSGFTWHRYKLVDQPWHRLWTHPLSGNGGNNLSSTVSKQTPILHTWQDTESMDYLRLPEISGVVIHCPTTSIVDPLFTTIYHKKTYASENITT